MTFPPALGVSRTSTGSLARGASLAAASRSARSVSSPLIPPQLDRRGTRAVNTIRPVKEQAKTLRRIGINALFLEERQGGLETYVRELIPALLRVRPELVLRIYVSAKGKLLLEREAWGDAVELVSHPLLGLPGTRAVIETTFLGWLATRHRLDVLHNVALTAPLRTRAANLILLS